MTIDPEEAEGTIHAEDLAPEPDGPEEAEGTVHADDISADVPDEILETADPDDNAPHGRNYEEEMDNPEPEEDELDA